MGIYAAAASTAHALLSSRGADVTFSRKKSGSFDPITQTETGGGTFSITMKGVGIPPGRSAENRIGSLERRNIVELHLAPREGAVPEVGDTARWAQKDWTVIWISELDPAADGSPYALAYLER